MKLTELTIAATWCSGNRPEAHINPKYIYALKKCQTLGRNNEKLWCLARGCFPHSPSCIVWNVCQGGAGVRTAGWLCGDGVGVTPMPDTMEVTYKGRQVEKGRCLALLQASSFLSEITCPVVPPS